MRNLVGLFGILCGAVVIGMVARHGYKTTDNEIDGALTAFMFGLIAMGGLGGHAVAIRVWQRNGWWACVIGVIAALALVVNLSNSLGVILGRGDVRLAERTQKAQAVKDSRAELERALRERDSMPPFQSTTPEAVRVAREAVASAERITKAECAVRRAQCRERELEEHARRTDLAQAVSHQVATVRAEKIDADIARIRAELKAAPPVQRMNSDAAAIAQLFRWADSDVPRAEFLKSLSVAIIAELLIVGALIVFELMDSGRAEQAVPRTASNTTMRVAEEETVGTAIVHEQSVMTLAPPVIGEPVVSLTANNDVIGAVTNNDKPDAVSVKDIVVVNTVEPQAPHASGAALAPGDVGAFVYERLAPAEGKSVAITELYTDYCRWCTNKDKRPLDQSDVERWFATIGKKVNLVAKRQGRQMVCQNVELAA